MAGNSSTGGIGHFLPGSLGPIFVFLRRPLDVAKGTVLVVPPFAEEMNKSRRMVAEVSLRLAGRGWASVIPDLYGTGDSGGDFGDADWESWEGDIGTTVGWCEQTGHRVNAILAVRLGCALVVSSMLSAKLPEVRHTVLWQPVFDGNRFLTQFLRLRVAASLIEDGKKDTVEEFREQLRNGSELEVAGYGLSPELAAGLHRLVPPEKLPLQMGRVTWMEVVRVAGAAVSSASSRLIDASRALGRRVDIETFAGEPFWASTEVVTIEQMLNATVAVLSDETSDEAESVA